MKCFNLFSLPIFVWLFISRISFRALLLRFLFLMCFTQVLAQKDCKPAQTGYINFNVLSNSQGSKTLQTLSLYGCNTSITKGDSAYWRGSKGLVWDSLNQVLAGIPYGCQTNTINNTLYYVSKYYIASPPVFDMATANNPATLYDIGLVTPDEFVLNGVKPAQLVYLNYDVLKQMYIKYFAVKFDESFKKLGHSELRERVYVEG